MKDSILRVDALLFVSLTGRIEDAVVLRDQESEYASAYLLALNLYASKDLAGKSVRAVVTTWWGDANGQPIPETRRDFPFKVSVKVLVEDDDKAQEQDGDPTLDEHRSLHERLT